MSNKLKNTRIVTLKEDYATIAGKVILAKGSVHAMHKTTVAKIQDRGAKLAIKEVNIEQEREKARRVFSDNEKKRTAAMWN